MIFLIRNSAENLVLMHLIKYLLFFRKPSDKKVSVLIYVDPNLWSFL